MTQLLGLFSNQKEAEQAINALANANLEDSAIHTIESWNEKEVPVIVPSVLSNSGSAIGGAVLMPDLSVDNDTKEFLQRSLESGGVLVAVDPEDDLAFAQAKRILEKQGGQVFSD